MEDGLFISYLLSPPSFDPCFLRPVISKFSLWRTLISYPDGAILSNADCAQFFAYPADLLHLESSFRMDARSGWKWQWNSGQPPKAWMNDYCTVTMIR